MMAVGTLQHLLHVVRTYKAIPGLRDNWIERLECQVEEELASAELCMSKKRLAAQEKLQEIYKGSGNDGR